MWTVPLSGQWHLTGEKAQHNSNERMWWLERGIDPCVVALALWAHSGDYEAGLLIVEKFNEQVRL
jgi:hypothetical protein